ncbi:MAG: hypothetical protein ACYC91_10855 [Solirubrobacteraceae bacterium]
MSDGERQQSELEALRARVSALEAELIEVQAWANEVVGDAQARTYWLDRWQLDLNSVVERPGVQALRRALRTGRRVYRRLVAVKRRWLT